MRAYSAKIHSLSLSLFSSFRSFSSSGSPLPRYSPLPLLLSVRSKKKKKKKKKKKISSFLSRFHSMRFLLSLPPYLSCGEKNFFVSAPGFVLPLLHFRHARFVDPASKQRDFLGPPFFLFPSKEREREREGEREGIDSVHEASSSPRRGSRNNAVSKEPNLA